MLPDYALPAIVVVLKMFFRLYVGHTATRVDVAKILFAFPLDLAFLAISFSAVFLGYMQANAAHPLSTKATLAIFGAYILAAFIVSLLVKKSDEAFIIDRPFASFCWTLPAYFISTGAIFLSVWIWGS